MKESEATYQETTYQDLSKRRAADDEGEEKLGALGHDYDILLHFAIAHMRRVDGALPGKQDGSKSLDLLAPAGEHK